jgi:hypothetical protein
MTPKVANPAGQAMHEIELGAIRLASENERVTADTEFIARLPRESTL